MRRTWTWIASSFYCLSLAIGLGPAARADLLDPRNFASLGAFPSNGDPLFINSGGDPSNPSSPTLIDIATGQVVATGVVSNGIAVFTFDSIHNATFVNSAFGTNPVAFLSYGDVEITSLDVSAPPHGGGPGGAGGPGSGPGEGASGGSGGPPGRPNSQFGNQGLFGAGNLLNNLGGGGTGTGGFFDPAGGGGGAVEIGALGNITIGSIAASGTGGGGSFGMYFGAGGGGGGGGVLIHGNSVDLTGTIDVHAGDGGPGGFIGGAGGGGGGGEIDIITGTGGYRQALPDSQAFDVRGGLAGTDLNDLPGGPTNGSDGSVHIVPEPSSLVLVAVGGLGLLGLARYRGGSKWRGSVPRPVVKALLALAVFILARPSTAEAQFNPINSGFILDRSGSLTTFDFNRGYYYTSVEALNNTGEAAGDIRPGENGRGYSSGYLRDAAGNFSTFSITAQNSDVHVIGLNDSGSIVGNYYDPRVNTEYGFLRTVSGTITTISAGATLDTFIAGVNNLGQVAGYYYDPAGGQVGGFVRDSVGAYTLFRLGGSTTQTLVESFNNLGATAGIYGDGINYDNKQGFIRDASGAVTSFNIAGGQILSISGMDDAGEVAGLYLKTGYIHGFLRSSSGVIIDLGSMSFVLLNNIGETTWQSGDREYIRDASGNITSQYLPNQPSVIAFNDAGQVGGTYISAVPEPSSLVLIAVGGFGLLGLARYRGRSSGRGRTARD